MTTLEQIKTEIINEKGTFPKEHYVRLIDKYTEQEPCDDAVSREIKIGDEVYVHGYVDEIRKDIMIIRNEGGYFSGYKSEVVKELPSVRPQEQTGQYEKHINHTDCIWYGSDSGCPVTCSQYRDGWNDAMDYIFKNGKGYQPYRHDG